MLNEQGDTQTGDRHEAFESCGIFRPGPFASFSKERETESPVNGICACRVYNRDDTYSRRLCSRSRPQDLQQSIRLSVEQRRPSTIYKELSNGYADRFAKSLDVFIDHLEGVKRPMEAVATDFLRHCVEFLRIVRSVRGANLTEFSVKSPVLCSTLIVERSINCALFTDLCHLN